MGLVTTVDLLRHGQAQGGEIFRGHTDVPLSDDGWQQMHEAVASVTGWQQILSSPMQRCQQFAEALAKQRDIDCQVADDLREISFGDWDGMSFKAVGEQYGALFNDYWRDPIDNTPPNAEPMLAFCERIQRVFWQGISEHEGKHLLMVVHGGVIRSILSDILKSDTISLMRYEVPYACLTRFKIYHEEGQCWPQLVFHNYGGM